MRPIASSFALRLVAVAVAIVVFGSSCGHGENSGPAGAIRFTNETENRIALIVTPTEAGLQWHFDRRAPQLPPINEPGETWTFGNNVVPSLDSYCQDESTYWFVTPKEPVPDYDGGVDPNRMWSVNDVIVIEELIAPCWDLKDEYTVTGQ